MSAGWHKIRESTGSESVWAPRAGRRAKEAVGPHRSTGALFGHKACGSEAVEGLVTQVDPSQCSDIKGELCFVVGRGHAGRPIGAGFKGEPTGGIPEAVGHLEHDGAGHVLVACLERRGDIQNAQP